MSNERIDEILTENNLGWGAGWVKPDMRAGIIKAIQQYGAEQYQKGRMDQEKVENFKLGLQSDELNRLREFVKAQKEFLEHHDKLAETDFLTKKEWMKTDVLRNQIKSLES